MRMAQRLPRLFFFFFNDTATTEIYTLSLHDALPIWSVVGEKIARLTRRSAERRVPLVIVSASGGARMQEGDRKSTRLNSSHSQISYAVFCLRKKNAASQSRRTRRASPRRWPRTTANC